MKRSIIDIIINIILAPFTLIYSIVTWSSHKKGARKNCYLLRIDYASYSKLLDICQERGVPPGVVKNIVETKYNSCGLHIFYSTFCKWDRAFMGNTDGVTLAFAFTVCARYKNF